MLVSMTRTDTDGHAAEGERSVREDLRRGRDELGELRRDLTDVLVDLRSLAQMETELARAEMRESAQAAAQSAIFAGAGVYLAVLMGVFFALAGMFALDLVVPLWAAALIVGGVLLVLAAIVLFVARSRMQQITVVPSRAMSSVREDLEWARHQLTSSVR
jgi:hypothetical protein